MDIMDKVNIIADTVSDAFKELDRIFDILFGIQIKAPGRSKRCCILFFIVMMLIAYIPQLSITLPALIA